MRSIAVSYRTSVVGLLGKEPVDTLCDVYIQYEYIGVLVMHPPSFDYVLELEQIPSGYFRPMLC